MNIYKLHVETLLWSIQELLPEDHFVRHSNSYNFLLKEMNKYSNSGLSEQELELEKLVDKIKTTESTLECIRLVSEFITDSTKLTINASCEYPHSE